MLQLGKKIQGTAFGLGVFLLILCAYSAQNRKERSIASKDLLVPFEQSMSRSGCYIADGVEKVKRWKRVQQLYDRHVFRGTPSKESRIPKTIHQIWIGSPVPQKYLQIQKSWKEHHPDWEYRLWTDADIEGLVLQNRQLYETSTNWGEKSDILRYEILYQFGGLYVDMDFECIRSFELFHHLCDFYVGLERMQDLAASPHVGNALIGSCAFHPILAECITLIASGQEGSIETIQQRTGPGLLTRCFLKKGEDPRFKSVAFPFTYFYPLPASERDGSVGGKVKELWTQEESYAIHYWDSSWL